MKPSCFAYRPLDHTNHSLNSSSLPSRTAGKWMMFTNMLPLLFFLVRVYPGSLMFRPSREYLPRGPVCVDPPAHSWRASGQLLCRAHECFPDDVQVAIGRSPVTESRPDSCRSAQNRRRDESASAVTNCRDEPVAHSRVPRGEAYDVE